MKRERGGREGGERKRARRENKRNVNRNVKLGSPVGLMPGLPAQWRAARSDATAARHFIASSCELRWHSRQDYGVQIRMTTVRLSSLHSLLVFNGEIATAKACVRRPMSMDVYTGCVRLIRDILTTIVFYADTQRTTMFIVSVNLISRFSSLSRSNLFSE